MSVTETRTIKLSDARKYLKHHFKKRQPVMIWGPPGIGKSDLIASIARDFDNCHLIDVRLSLWEPTDIKGIPYYNANENTMAWAPPNELPDEKTAKKYNKIILFLDELNGAAPAVQAAAYQLILNRRVGTYRLPDNVFVVAAGNRESDKGVTYRMPKPLANRFIHYEIRVDFDDWYVWAINNKIHSDVIGYLTFAKNDLYSFDARSNDRSFATPRSWHFVSNILEDLDTFASSEVNDMVAGAIGEGIGLKFSAHRAISNQLPNPSLILDGKIKNLKTKEISVIYSLSTSLIYELKVIHDEIDKTVSKEEYHTKFDNMLRFMIDNFQPEIIVMAIQMCSSLHNMYVPLRHIDSGKEFLKSYGDLILSMVSP